VQFFSDPFTLAVNGRTVLKGARFDVRYIAERANEPATVAARLFYPDEQGSLGQTYELSGLASDGSCEFQLTLADPYVHYEFEVLMQFDFNSDHATIAIVMDAEGLRFNPSEVRATKRSLTTVKMLAAATA